MPLPFERNNRARLSLSMPPRLTLIKAWIQSMAIVKSLCHCSKWKFVKFFFTVIKISSLVGEHDYHYSCNFTNIAQAMLSMQCKEFVYGPISVLIRQKKKTKQRYPFISSVFFTSQQSTLNSAKKEIYMYIS